MSQAFPIVVVGGNSLVGSYLIKRLQAEGVVAEVISRHEMKVPEGFRLTRMDMTQARNWIAPESSIVISLLPMPVLTQFLPRFIGVKSIIAVSNIATNTAPQENAFHSWCLRSNVHGTMLRTTMVYDGVNDQNIAQMVRFIRRWRCLPVAAPAQGLCQPIHADDVATAVVNGMNNEAVYGKSLNIAGGEILNYRDMVQRVFEALQIKPRLVMLSAAWTQKAYAIGMKIGIFSAAAFEDSVYWRMNQDLVFDNTESLKVLNYHPRDFNPEFPSA